MQINYEEEARKRQREQESYQRQRDPFQYGQEVARRRYSEIMSGLQNQKLDVSRSYSDMYQRAKEMAVADRAKGGPSLSGGMKAQYSDLLSTREIGAIGQIGQAQDQALRQLQQQEQSAFSNAQLEGQQATQMQLGNQQAALQVVQQKQQILADKNLTEEQKKEQLNALGIEYTAVEAEPSKTSPFVAVLGGLAGLTAAGGALASYGVFGASAKSFMLGTGSKLGLLKPVLSIAGKAVPWLILLWGAEKIFEAVQGKGAEGGFIGTEGLIKTRQFNI